MVCLRNIGPGTSTNSLEGSLDRILVSIDQGLFVAPITTALIVFTVALRTVESGHAQDRKQRAVRTVETGHVHKSLLHHRD